MRNISDKVVGKNQNTRFISYYFFFRRKSCCLCDSVEKYGRDGQATRDTTRGSFQKFCTLYVFSSKIILPYI